MPQYIPGVDSVLGPAFGQISEAVADFINPQRKFQDAILAGISQDPSLIQKFADLEAQQPGFLQRLGVPALAGNPSAEAEFQANSRPDIVDARKQELKNKMAAMKIDSQKLNILSDALRNNPNAFSAGDINNILRKEFQLPSTSATATEDANAKIVGVRANIAEPLAAAELTEQQGRATITSVAAGIAPDKSAAELKEQQGRAEITSVAAGSAPAKAAADIAQANTQQAEAELKLRGLTALDKLLASGRTVNIDDFMDENKFTAAERLGIMQTELGNALILQSNEQAKRDRAVYEKHSDEKSAKMLLRNQAYNLFGKVRVPASMEIYERALMGEGISWIGKSDRTLTPEQKQLADIQRAITSLTPQERDVQLNRNQDNIRASLAAFENAEDEDIKSATASQLSTLLQHAATLNGIQPYKVAYEKIDKWGPFNSTELVWRDINNRVVSRDQALAGIPISVATAPTTKNSSSVTFQTQRTDTLPPVLPPDTTAKTSSGPKTIDQLKADLAKLSAGERQATIQKLLAEAPNDAVRARLKSVLGIK